MIWMEENKLSGALFSEDKKYRYALWRIFDPKKSAVMYIGLNPSTANETANDATIRKVAKITKHNGYGGFYMMNLFAIISTDPGFVLRCKDPIGQNDHWLHEVQLVTEATIVCWGNFEVAKDRAKEVMKIISFPLCLEINKSGSPKHPLYCKDLTDFKQYKL